MSAEDSHITQEDPQDQPKQREQDLNEDDVHGEALNTAKDRFGFFLNDDFHRAQSVSLELQSQRLAKEQARQKKWTVMRQQWQNHFRFKYSPKPLDRLSKDELRAIVALPPCNIPTNSNNSNTASPNTPPSKNIFASPLQQQTIETHATHRPLSITARHPRHSITHKDTTQSDASDPYASLRDAYATLVPVVSATLKRRVRKGIPDALRGEIWFDLIDAQRVQRAYPHPATDIDIFQIPKNTLEEIERDIDRTFPRHVLFIEKDGEGQCSLRRLLQWYAALDTEVGYCQGMGFLAALFLTYMPEENAFYTFYACLTRRQCPLRMMFLPRLVEMQVMLHVIDHLGQQFLPRLWQHFNTEGVHVTMFFTEWAMAFFCRGFSFELVTRVWDVLLLEGRLKMVYRVSLGILQHVEKQLLDLKFEKIMSFLRELPEKIDSVAVVNDCWLIPLKTKHILDAEEEYWQQKTAGQGI